VLPKGPVARACWCALGVNPGSSPVPTNGSLARIGIFFKGMSRWFPSKIDIQKWTEDQEKDFIEAQKKNPKLSTKDWLQRYIFIDIHEIFFGGIHQELHEWLARLVDTQSEIRSIPPVVWTSTLIQKVKRIDNYVSRQVDHLFDSTIGGYITTFVVDKT
jgi:hypothetical protein